MRSQPDLCPHPAAVSKVCCSIAQARSSAFADRLSFDSFWPPGAGAGSAAGGGARRAPPLRALERIDSDCELRGLRLGALIGRGSYAQVYRGARYKP